MRSLAGLFVALVALAAAAPAQADPSVTERAGTAAASAGEQIKEGAGKVGTAVKDGAVDLYEAGKAAVSAGSKKFEERRATHESSGSTVSTDDKTEKTEK